MKWDYATGALYGKEYTHVTHRENLVPSLLWELSFSQISFIYLWVCTVVVLSISEKFINIITRSDASSRLTISSALVSSSFHLFILVSHTFSISHSVRVA